MTVGKEDFLKFDFLFPCGSKNYIRVIGRVYYNAAVIPCFYDIAVCAERRKHKLYYIHFSCSFQIIVLLLLYLKKRKKSTI